MGAAFTSTATQHGGQETTLFSIIANLMHFGMVIVGLPYSFKDMMAVDQVVGGVPYGTTTIAGGDGSRQPSRSSSPARATRVSASRVRRSSSSDEDQAASGREVRGVQRLCSQEPPADRYELTVGGKTAVAAYRREGDIVTFTHTGVPQELEGQGVASRLVAGALADVRDRGLRIVPECPFIAGYVHRHPEVRDPLAE